MTRALLTLRRENDRLLNRCSRLPIQQCQMAQLRCSNTPQVLHESFEVAQVAVHPTRDRAVKAGAYL